MSRTSPAAWSVVADFAAHGTRQLHKSARARCAWRARSRLHRSRARSTLYRERLTWFSDSDLTLGYRHLEGIPERELCRAISQVSPAENGGSRIEWSATVDRRTEPGLSDDCAGTKAIFEMGIEALGESTRSRSRCPSRRVRATCASSPETRAPSYRWRSATSADSHPAKGATLCLFLHGIGGGVAIGRRSLASRQHPMTAAALDLRGYGDSALGRAKSR